MTYGSRDTEWDRHNFFVILGNFLPFYQQPPQPTWRFIILQMCTINDSHMMHGSWDMECNRQDFFCHFEPKIPKNQNFEKMKKPPENITILHRCNISDNHIMYGSRDTKCDRQNFIVILGHFLPFYPLTTQKIKILKKSKNYWEILSFYTSVP